MPTDGPPPQNKGSLSGRFAGDGAAVRDGRERLVGGGARIFARSLAAHFAGVYADSGGAGFCRRHLADYPAAFERREKWGRRWPRVTLLHCGRAAHRVADGRRGSRGCTARGLHWGPKAGASLAAGALLSWLNFRWMKQGVGALVPLATAQERRPESPHSQERLFEIPWPLRFAAACRVCYSFAT